MKVALVVLAIMAAVGMVANERQSDAIPPAKTAGLCLVASNGSTLCDANARVYCESISVEEIIGTGDDTYIRRNIADARLQDACVGVGWVN